MPILDDNYEHETVHKLMQASQIKNGFVGLNVLDFYAKVF